MDKVRQLILARVSELDTSLKSASLAIGRSHAYLQQFVHRGVPKELPEKTRAKLAEFLRVDEFELGGPPRQARVRAPERSDLFVLKEVDVRAGAAFGGGLDETDWVVPAAGGRTVSSHQPLAEWRIPTAYARQELALTPGKADILTVKGDSMDDGTSYGLASGDRVIVDLSDTDARQGTIFAVWDGGGVIIKQVEIVRGSEPVEIVCTSLNKRYTPIRLTVDGNVHLIGRVAAKISRM